MFVHRKLGSQFPPFLLAPTTESSEPAANGSEPPGGQTNTTATVNVRPDSNAATPETDKGVTTIAPAVNSAGSGESGIDSDSKPDVDELVARINEELFGPKLDTSPPRPALRYQDGTVVDVVNHEERQAYERYREEKGKEPPSRAALRAYYRQQTLTR
jgi:hypothetical protein